MSFSRRLLQNLTIGFLLVIQLLPVVSAEVPLVAFEANYELFYGKSRAADAQLSLAQAGDNWRWLLTTKPRGLASLLTSKKPYSETIFARVDGNHRIQELIIADDAEKAKKVETAKFDWNSAQVETVRKEVTNKLPLTVDVYDNLSIHLFSAKMLDENLPQASVEFYYKGRVVKSELKQLEKMSLTLNEKDVEVMVVEQSVQDSSTKYTYYYDPSIPFIPMKIVTGKPDKKATTWLYVPTK
jgi:hypothetical protein